MKEFQYRGKSLGELKEIDTREFAKLLTSTARRTVLRQFDLIENFINRCKKKIAKNKPIRTHSRNLVIVPRMVEMVIYVHDGKQYKQIKIIPEMIGHKLGEFAQTRGKVQHGAPGVGATRSSAALSVK